jgi:N-ethylmaleimide reductase
MNFPSLFSPLQIGPYQLTHRVAMAPLTRMRAERPSLAPRPLNAEYYAQRATPGGLIIAEASPVMATGHGNPGVPGIYSEAQIKGWREVVDAVHAKGGVIFLQLWHVGRVSHSSFQPGGALPVAPSAVPISAELKTMTADGKPASYETPRALETSEIPGVVESFRRAAINAQKAGFDGVEIHGANGRLRRSRDPRRQRLSDRAIFAVAHQFAHRPIWRIDRKSRPASDGDHASRCRNMGR